MLRTAIASLFSVLFVVAACKTPAPQMGASTLETADECSVIEAKVKALQAELKEITARAEPNADGVAACKDKAGAKWNTQIGRCECITDPTKFSGNAWSIRNTLKCEAAVDSFNACKGKAGARWNAEIGRCECITDPTKFSGNAWSIKNTLKCQAATDSWQACKEVHGAIWNEEIGRCECESDPTRFQGNAWSIRNHLTCLGGSAVDDAVKADQFLSSDTMIALTDGEQPTRDKDTVEKELAAAADALKACRERGAAVGATSTPAATKGACIFIRNETKQVQATCVPDADQAACDNAYKVYYQSQPAFERRLVLGKSCDAAKDEAAAASKPLEQGSTGSTTQVNNTGACLIKSKTSAKEYCQTLTNEGCDGWAERNGNGFDRVSFTAAAACATTASKDLSTTCSCSFSKDGRYCGIWKNGRLFGRYYGPLGGGWNCDKDATRNNLCNTDTLRQIMASPDCR